MLHPAEFREVVLAAGAGAVLGSMLGCELDDNPQLSLAASEGVDHVGGGLYRVTGPESVSFTFATTLCAGHVDELLAGIDDVEVNSREPDASTGARPEDSAVTVSLVQDNGLGVTLVVICALDPALSDFGACVATRAVSACLVAEMEQIALGRGESAA